MTWRELLAEARRRVGDRQAAQWIGEQVSAWTPAELDAALDLPVTERAIAGVDAMVARYTDGEPLQYVLGAWAFRGLDLAVDHRALIPRPETELVVDVVLGLITGTPVTIADLGTGTGAIGLALASELPLEGVEVWITDVSPEAIDLASANLAGIGRAATNVRVATGSWYQALPDDVHFDVIVSNPPYVPDADPALEQVVRRHEPHVALYGGADGLDHVREVVAGAPARLRPGGWLVLEIGAAQGDRARALLGDAGLVDVEIRQDLAGHDRIALARLL